MSVLVDTSVWSHVLRRKQGGDARVQVALLHGLEIFTLDGDFRQYGRCLISRFSCPDRDLVRLSLAGDLLRGAALRRRYG